MFYLCLIVSGMKESLRVPFFIFTDDSNAAPEISAKNKVGSLPDFTTVSFVFLTFRTKIIFFHEKSSGFLFYVVKKTTHLFAKNDFHGT